MGWVIDPEEEVVFVYFNDHTIRLFDATQQLIPTPSFATNFRLTIGELFGWLTE